MREKNRPCPKCRAVGHDRSGEHLWIMKDGLTWTCQKPYHPKYFEENNKEITRKDMAVTVEEIKQLPFLGSIDRKISKETHEKFRVRTELSESDRSPVAVYYPETSGGKLLGYKRRGLPKSFTVVSEGGKGVPDFFGQTITPRSGKKILITGGEEDAMAAYEMLITKYPQNEPAIVSLPRGEDTSNATITANLDYLKGFEEVIIATDMDEVGRKAIGRIAPIIGERVRVLVISEKDISNMLTKNKSKEFINAYYNPREYRPSNIVCVGDILEASIKPVNWGLSYPYRRLTELTYGLKEEEGEIISVGAGPGSGKTTLMSEIQQHLMFVHGRTIAVFDIEQKAQGALKRLIGGIMGKPIHKPDCIYDVEQARSIGDRLKGKVEFYDGLTEDWDEVKDNIRYFASKGIRVFFIDPLSALVEHLSASEGNQQLGLIMRDMRRFRVEQGLTFFSVNHLNNPSGGKDHGAGGDVYGSQFSGSRAQWKYSTALWGLSRDQLSIDPDEKNRCKLSIIKDRLGGNTGHLFLQYNPLTGKLTEEVDLDGF